MQSTTELFGRERDRRRLIDRVAGCRLVTVTGVGGVGKTALALDVAHTLAETFDGDVRVCELAGEFDPAAIRSTVGAQLGTSLANASTALGTAKVLVVLDNCEHVRDAAADVATTLLAAGDGVHVLATSREPLAVDDEHVVAIDALDVPATDELADVETSSAVRLFCARATASGSRLTLDAASAAAIAQVCRRLDGLPLAIRLAAARTRTLTPDEIDRHLDDRFGLLARRVPRGPERHRSLRATIDWSYELLESDEQQFFDALGIFDDRFTVEAARRVTVDDCEPVLALVTRLDGLVQRSLLVVESSPLGTRYRLLDSLRDYARQHLMRRGRLASTRERYLDYLVDTAAKIQAAGCTAWNTETYVSFFAEYENLRAGTEWCVTHDQTADRAYALFEPMGFAIDNARALSVAQFGQRLLARWPDPSHRRWPTVAALTATALATEGDVDGARRLATGALEQASGDFATVMACRVLCMIDNAAGRAAEALEWVERSEHAARQDGGVAPFLCELSAWRAQGQYHLGRRDDALATVSAMRTEALRLDSVSLEMSAELVRGCLLVGFDDASAVSALDGVVEQARARGYAWGLRNALRSRGAAALIAGDPADAAKPLSNALDEFVATGNDGEVWWTLRWIAAALVACGDRDTARVLLATRLSRPPVLILTMLEHRYLPDLLGDLNDTPPGLGSLRGALALAHEALDGLADAPDRTGGRGGPNGQRDAALDNAENGNAALGNAENGNAANGDAGAVLRAVEVARPGRGVAADRSPPDNRWSLDGEYWTLSYAGNTVRLRDAKGLRDLARLLAAPDRAIHCRELMGAQLVEDDTGPMLDGTARRGYRARLHELADDVADAESAHDSMRAQRARDERDALTAQLTAASGLAGRTRRSGSSVERARSAVGWRVRATIKRIAAMHPALGRHLDRSVQLGVWCRYAPDDADGSPTWQV